MTDQRFRIISVVVIAIMAVIWLMPVYTLFNTSFKTQAEVAEQNYLKPPKRLQLANFVHAFKALKIGLRNSIIISSVATFLCIFLGSLAAYSLTKFNFRFAIPVFFSIVMVTFLPYQIILIPITHILMTLRLLNSYAGLILIYVILNSPMAALITATFFMKVPVDLEEAAALDGCPPFTFYLKILVPVSLPGLVAATILVFVQIYNEFLLGIVLTRGPDVKPVMPFLAELKGTEIAQWHIQMAGALITSLIPVAVFAFLGRYFVSGLMAGYGKG